MITVSGVSMNFGEQVLFENVAVTFNKGERYALTGPNGSGKSTFMKIVAGDLEPMAGSVQRPKRLSTLRQDHFRYENYRIIDTVMMGNERLWAALSEKEVLLAKPDLTDEEGMRLGELEGVIAEEDGYSAEAEATELLDGLGIPEEVHAETMSTLTGGNKVRVLLAQALFGKPDALLLDEPTNHLDIASIRWLEAFLKDYDGVLVLISHDRQFVNSVATKVADIDYETIILYNGNYDAMVEAKAEARSALELANEAKSKRITALQEFVQRFRAGSRASQVKSREKAIEREKQELALLKRSNIQRPFIRFDLKRPSGRQVLTVSNLTKGYEGHEDLIDGFNLSVMRGDKIAIVGPNGIGKTTLLRMLHGSLKPDQGSVEWGFEAQIGYMPQDHSEMIEKSNQTAHAWLWASDAKTDEQEIRSLFGRMLFTKDEPMKPTSVLSGGETVRLLLARLMLTKPNVLLLDEPTNHLDLEAIRALTQGLAAFEGTCVFVTHDRQMVSRVATRVLEMSNSGIRELSPQQFDSGDYLTGYSRYRAQQLTA